ncbi:agmatine deiminase family protein [Deinococcus deserti]|uniref:Putative agmatine deiminase n=1 Tax=Deinococcus deserti (strain DSM 17065 / CIP 109153 / LMG 22923 / VCD115) TaxID=546414 RepID=C1D043_DEIDV|nr:agmatine deiminase family protein [Deinococcus deserti]ACO47312.2 putative agmatine deiminase [Deinococcus deserti VCD115]
MQHFLPSDPTPRELGFRMPAEWESHAATWMSWPADDELWFGHLLGVREEFAELVRTIARFEPVQLLVRDPESEQDARGRLEGADVTYHRLPLDDVWLRDNGPIFVRRGNDLAFVNWRFNSWGGKFNWEHDDQVPEYVAQVLGAAHWDRPEVLEGGGLEVNGLGVGLTTRSCFLTDTRNPGLTEEDYGALLNDTLGVSQLLWLDGGLENDHTDGHIDTITRFTDERTIVTSVESNPADPNHAVMQKNLEALRRMTDQDGQPFRIVELPLPASRLEGAEGRLPPTYANFYIGNGFVVVPMYGDPNDARAIEVLRPLFPQREVIGLPSRKIIEGGGSFHCVTQQQPQGTVWTGE